MAKYKVMRAGRMGDRPAAPEELEELSKVDAELVGLVCNTEDELITGAKDADILLFGGAQFTRRVVESLPKLRAIMFGSVGFDQVDVDAATENGIVVCNNPSPNWCNEEVSNHTIALLLNCAKKLVLLNNILENTGDWAAAKDAIKPMGAIHGQTLGLIGAGSIGLMTARKAQCFSLKVLVYDPYLSKEVAKENGVTLVSMAELLRESDYISVHTPLNDETRHILSEKEFNQMKSSAYVINTARGPVIDEQAMIKALQAKKIAGAGLDVFEKEPIDPDNPLLKMDNVITIPHSASYSDEAFSLPARIVARSAVQILSGQWPGNLVNKSVEPRFPLK